MKERGGCRDDFERSRILSGFGRRSQDAPSHGRFDSFDGIVRSPNVALRRSSGAPVSGERRPLLQETDRRPQAPGARAASFWSLPTSFKHPGAPEKRSKGGEWALRPFFFGFFDSFACLICAETERIESVA